VTLFILPDIILIKFSAEIVNRPTIVLHCFLLRILLHLAVDFRISVDRVLTKDVALVVVYVYCQAVFFGLGTESTGETMVLVEWVSVWVLLAYKAFIGVLL
jgi:hypothetical protein